MWDDYYDGVDEDAAWVDEYDCYDDYGWGYDEFL